jgi:hypothetical protein
MSLTRLHGSKLSFAPLAKNIGEVESRVRAEGFETPFCLDDWYAHVCSDTDRRLHKRIMEAWFVEQLYACDQIDMMHKVGYGFVSPLLARLASERDVDVAKGIPYANTGLSPCLNLLHSERTRGGGPPAEAFATRRACEFQRFSRMIDSRVASFGDNSDQRQLQAIFCGWVERALSPKLNAKSMQTAGNETEVVVANWQESVDLLVRPRVVIRAGAKIPDMVGAVGVWVWLKDTNTMEESQVFIDLALPGQWSAFRAFESAIELGLLFFAWEFALRELFEVLTETGLDTAGN